MPVGCSKDSQEEMEMRVLILAKESEQSQTATPPTAEAMAEHQKFNEELVKAGVVVGSGRLSPSAQGKRVRFEGKKRTVLDGPFAETKELVAGYWIIQAKSKDEAIQWAKGIPFADGEEVELRQVFEPEDFPADVLPPKEAAREQAWRAEQQRKSKP